jgi:F1F0 ATPase subunit 2
MNDIIGGVAAGLAGMALGGFFFGGLWWTVRSSVSSPRPGLLIFVSLLLRLGMTLAGFYLVAGGHWQPLVACLLGFVVARVIIVRFITPRFEHHSARHHDMLLEITHEP